MGKILKKIESGILKNRKAMGLILICEVLLILLAVNLISQSVVLNKNDEKIIDENRPEDEVQCTDGVLTVNKVSAEVPSGDNVSYNIAYSWGPDDTDYPTIPHAAIASVKGEDGSVAYDISLYRDSYAAKAEIPEGKNAENWFEDWGGSEEAAEDSPNWQGPVTAGDINGFLIKTGGQDNGEEETSAYSVRTFYFTYKHKDGGLSIYILEGILYSPQSQEEFEAAFEKCMESIKK